jgi:hypothetical protein
MIYGGVIIQRGVVSMRLSKRAMLVAGSSVLLALSTGALAQTPKGNAKSSEAGTIGEGEAYMIGKEGHRLHKSKVKVSAATHEAAMKKGAREVRPGTVIYKQGGKLYMMEDSANEKASSNFQSNFDIDY